MITVADLTTHDGQFRFILKAKNPPPRFCPGYDEPYALSLSVYKKDDNSLFESIYMAERDRSTGAVIALLMEAVGIDESYIIAKLEAEATEAEKAGA